MIVTNCCHVKFNEDSTVCPECRLEATNHIIPTTHEEKSFYLYGDVDMGELFREGIPQLKRRIATLEANKIRILNEPLHALTYAHVTDILSSQKLFTNMIKECNAGT